MLSLLSRPSCSAWRKDVHTVSGQKLTIDGTRQFYLRSRLGHNTAEGAKSSEGAMEVL